VTNQVPAGKVVTAEYVTIMPAIYRPWGGMSTRAPATSA
jgi:hypothetical protein